MEAIIELNLEEVDLIAGGQEAAAGKFFTWAGIVQTIEWLGEEAYAAGVWVGSH